MQLVDATTGQPLAGVSVLAYLTDPPGGVAAASARTEAMRGSLQWSPTSDARGMVEFDLPPGQPLNLSIRPDLATHKPGTETVAPLAPYELRDLTVNVRGLRYTPYHGLVRSRADGGPVYGAGIRVLRSEVLERGAFVVDPAPPPDAGTDVQGRFQVDASEAGMVACIQAPGTGPVLIALDAVHSDAHLPREVSLAPSAWLSLRLLGERGRGLPKIPVTVRAHSVALMGQDDEPIPATMLEWKGTTNALGRVDFRNLPGDVTLAIAIDAGDGGVSRQPPQQILGPGEARELDWTVVGGTRLAGRLTGAASRQERGQELWLLPALEPGSRLLCAEDLGRVAHKVHTDSEGAFVFSGVPAGSWWVAPAPMGERSQLAP
ncbi:MAG: hypothetical protein R3E96_12425 [Planctomycetota bacterium]